MRASKPLAGGEPWLHDKRWLGIEVLGWLRIRLESKTSFQFLVRGSQLACLLHRCHRVDELEELFDAGDLERVLNPLADADQVQPAAVLLVSDVCAHQDADSGRINVGDVGEIQHERLGRIGTDLGLKIEEGGKNQRPGETQNALSIL